MPTTSNFGWTTPADTDLVKDGAAAIRTLGNGIDTSFVDLKGGTTGQVLAKASNTDLDFTWSNVDPLTILDAKGDLITATAADTPARLAVGTNGFILTADSSTSTGLKWVAPAGGGKVLQVIQDTLTSSFSTTSTTLVDTGLTVSITPSSATSKIMIYASGNVESVRSGSFNNTASTFALVRSSTQLQSINWGWYGSNNETNMEMSGTMAFSYLDDPATTSSVTYKIQARANTTNTTARVSGAADIIASIVVMEIGA